MTTYSAISFKCKSSHYIHYNDIMISQWSKGLKLTLLALSSTIHERNFDLNSSDWTDIGDRSYITHLTWLFFKEPIWCEITLNGFEMSTGMISCTFSETKLSKKSRSTSCNFSDILTFRINQIPCIYIYIYVRIKFDDKCVCVCVYVCLYLYMLPYIHIYRLAEFRPFSTQRIRHEF